MAIPYRRFGKTYRSDLQGSRDLFTIENVEGGLIFPPGKDVIMATATPTEVRGEMQRCQPGERSSDTQAPLYITQIRYLPTVSVLLQFSQLGMQINSKSRG